MTFSGLRRRDFALVALLLWSATLSGCRSLPFCGRRTADAVVCNVDMSWMSDVTIAPVCCDDGDNEVLLAFCGELATALHAHGVADIRIRDDCRVPCPADPLEMAGCPDQKCVPNSAYVLAVSVSDFRPYRPMRIAVDVRLIQTSDGRELARVVRVFHGSQEAPLRESPRRFILFREQKREARVDVEARTAFQTNSPAALVTCSAKQVTEQLSFQGLADPMAPPSVPMGGIAPLPEGSVQETEVGRVTESSIDPEQVPPSRSDPILPGPEIPAPLSSPEG